MAVTVNNEPQYKPPLLNAIGNCTSISSFPVTVAEPFPPWLYLPMAIQDPPPPLDLANVTLVLGTLSYCQMYPAAPAKKPKCTNESCGNWRG